ncbi:cell division protein FtsX [Bacteroidia bacterium]|nr:cell division protein FtsX [Bacteroidia bacterium]
MIKNFLFVLKRFKTSSVLNILGLSAAFAVFSITMIQCYYDFSFDRNFKQANDIYFCSFYQKNFDDRAPILSRSLSSKMADEFPEIKSYCLLRNIGTNEIRSENNPDIAVSVAKATPGFLAVFTPEIIMGDAKQVFTQPNKALLTEDVAHILFGKENPIGQILFMNGSDVPVTVLAVCKKYPENCSLENGIYTQLEIPDDWANWSMYEGYFLIDSKIISSLREKINSPESLKRLDKNENITKIELTSLPDVHFRIPEKGKGNLGTTVSLLAIGIISLLIALINFMNFSVAMIPSRVRSWNIQKILGANPLRLKGLVVSEALCFALLSFLISLFFVVFFQQSSLKEFFSADLSPENNLVLLTGIACVGIILILLFGLYPARFVTSFQPAMAVNHSFARSKQSALLRNILITIQFATAIALITVSIFIRRQHDYMVDYSWGIQKENIVYFPIKRGSLDINSLSGELKQNPDITDCTVSVFVPGTVGIIFGNEMDGKKVWFKVLPVTHHFLDFFGVNVIKGRNFIPSDDEQDYCIVNQAFLKKFDLTDDIVGTRVGKEDDKYSSFIAAGIVQDINFESLRTGIEPMAFVTNRLTTSYVNYLFLKISGQNTPQAIDFMKDTWKKFSDEPLDLKFLDATLDNMYQSENNLARLISIFGLIAVIIAVMGVYGLIVFNAKYKQKEIAIRKVNGSTIKEIMLMLNKNVLLQLGIAFAAAVPAAYSIVNKWLENFAYKTPMHWWVFLLGGFIILLITLLTVSAQSYKAARANPTKAINS